MSGQLLKVTTTPFQAVRFSQSARLVSSSSADLERRKAIARMRAFQSQHSSGGGNMDMKYVNRINQTFSTSTSKPAAAASFSDTKASVQTATEKGNSLPSVPVNNTSTAPAVPTVETSVSADAAAAIAADSNAGQISQAAVTQESNASYVAERGAFEFRVATGELSFLPSLTMTVITQRPEVHFEYLGGYHYVPASKFDGDIMTVSV